VNAAAGTGLSGAGIRVLRGEAFLQEQDGFDDDGGRGAERAEEVRHCEEKLLLKM
jgi:hypothetical protein